MHGPRPGRAPGGEGTPAVTPEIAAEAAVWVARLHGPDRSSRMERECVAWQARSAAHRLAFERCTDTWQDVALVTLRTYAAASPVGSPVAEKRSAWLPARTRRAFAVAGLVLAGAVLVGLQPWRDVERYSTGVGEQRVVMLSDGSRLSLNTGTRVQVEFSSAQRTVDVDGGEALFEVAKDAGRPFVVRAGGSEVLALGTVFSVRLSGRTADAGDSLAVTLVEGSVTVRAAAGVSHGLAPPQPVSLAAGDRVSLTRTARAELVTVSDRPRIDQVIAWKRDEAVFEDVALADAVAEMNRYSRRPLVLVEPVGSRGLRVSGLFKTGDSAGFARAVAALHGLAVREYADRLELVPN